MTFEVEIYDGAAPGDPLSYIDTLELDSARSILREKNELGSWSFRVPKSSADLALLTEYRWVKMRWNGNVVMSGRISASDQKSISPEEEAGQFRVVRGGGALATLADAPIGPHDDALLLRSSGEIRWYNFASPSYPRWLSAPWIPAYELYLYGDPAGYGDAPDDFHDHTAFWTWSEPAGTFGVDNPLQSIGTSYFRTEIHLADDEDSVHEIASDDYGELWVDGVLVWQRSEAFLWRRADRIELHMKAGWHTIAVKVENIPRASSATNGAGFIYSLWSTINGGELDTVLLHSDSTWQALHVPAAPPGFTPGEISIDLFDHVQGADFAMAWTWSHTEALDANGDPWAKEIEIGFRYGETMLDAHRKMAESAVDLDVDYDEIRLELYNKGGLDHGAAVAFAAAVDLLDLGHVSEPRVVTDLLVHQADGTFRWVSSGAGSSSPDDPKIGALLEAGGSPSNEATDDIAGGIFDRFSDTKIRASASVLSAAGRVPLADYCPGKIVTLPNAAGAGTATELLSVAIADKSPADDGTIGGSQTIAIDGLQ